MALLLLLCLLVLRRRRASDVEEVAQAPAPPPCALIFAGEAHATALTEAQQIECLRATTAEEFLELARKRKPTICFVDVDLLGKLNSKLPPVNVVGIVDSPAAQTLSKMVGAVEACSALSHVISSAALTSQLAKQHVESVLSHLGTATEVELLSEARVGRIAMLAQASHREARLARMQEYFEKQGVPGRTLAAIQEVGEELVMNALYNAPSEAGYFKTPVSRTEDVTLPLDRACEISYGIEGSIPYVRVRDTFGALRRERLVEVLSRCNSTGVKLDESRGGAGLGLWRVFSAATTVSVTVVPGKLTDILVRIAPRTGKAAPKHLLAVHLFLATDANDKLVLEHDSDLLDRSVTLVTIEAN